MILKRDLANVAYWEDEFRMKMASFMLGTSPAEVKSLYQAAVRDVDLLPTGELESLVNGDNLVSSGSNPSSSQRNESHQVRKRVKWSVEEEGLFLEGLTRCGKGRWKDISKHFVKTRTPAQVASHAQKFFLRLFPADNKEPKSDMPYTHRRSSKVAPSPTPPEQGCKAPVCSPDQFNGEQTAPNFSSLPPDLFDPVPDRSHPLQHQSDQTEQQVDPPSNPLGSFDQEQDPSILSAPIPTTSHQEAPLPGMDPTPEKPHQPDPEEEYLDFVSSLPDICSLEGLTRR